MKSIKESYKRYPMSWLYAGLGAATMFMGLMILDGFIQTKEDFTLVDVFGFSIMALAAFLIMSAFQIYRIDKISLQLQKIERDNRLQELQQEGKE